MAKPVLCSVSPPWLGTIVFPSSSSGTVMQKKVPISTTLERRATRRHSMGQICSSSHTELSLADLRYRCEGGSKLSLTVTVDGQPRWVLCLKKNADPDLVTQLRNICCYGNHVIAPLLGAQLAVPLRVVDLPEGLLPQILTQVQQRRPAYRLHSSVEPNSRHGLWMPDACVISSTLRHKHGPCFSVEVKPKRGFVPLDQEAPSVCRFCMRARVTEAGFKRSNWNVSEYCPLDLYSGCSRRTLDSLHRMVACPRNNIRIFRDGVPVFSAETDHSAEKLISELRELTDHVDPLQTLLTLVTEALLTPLPSPLRTSTEGCTPLNSTASSCVYQHSCEAPCVACTVGLPSTCVLGRLLRLQNLFPWGPDRLRAVLQAYKSFTKGTDWESSDQELSLFGSYHGKTWQQMLLDQLSDHPPSLSDPDSAMKELDRYVVSRTMRDCSIVIALQRIPSSTVCSEDPSPNRFYLAVDGECFLCQITVIDLDPKSKNVEKHWEKEKECLRIYKSVVTPTEKRSEAS